MNERGETRRIEMDAAYIHLLSAFDGVNAAPMLTSVQPDMELDVGEIVELDSARSVFDPDLEEVEIALEIREPASGGAIGIKRVGEGVFEVGAVSGGGEFLLRMFAADGALLASADWNYYSRAYEYSAAQERLCFFRDDQSPGDLHYEQIDQVTGAIVERGETPYHGDYPIEPPIVAAPSGDLIMIGSGSIFNAGAHAVLTAIPQQILIHPYEASDDTDGDGIVNTNDAFPLDPAASVDTDRDGYPEAWNAGASEEEES